MIAWTVISLAVTGPAGSGVRCSALLSDESVILSVCADPEPDNPVGGLNGNCTVMQTNACRPEAAGFLEMERWVLGVGLQQVERLVGKLLHW